MWQTNCGNSIAEIGEKMWQTNWNREEKNIRGNGIAEIGRKKNLWEPNYGNAIAEIGEKKFSFSNCCNGIAENERKKNKIK